MGIRAMKFDLFVLKALEKKGYTIEQLTSLDDNELDSLNLPDKIISQIKEYKMRGGKTPTQVAEELAKLMEQDSESTMSAVEVTEIYKDNNRSSFYVDVPDIETKNDAEEYIERVKEHIEKTSVTIKEDNSSVTLETDGSVVISSDSIDFKISDEVPVIRTIAKAEDIEIIKETLKKKELRSFASYTKLLKTEVPAAILDSVESTTINSLIDERIAEVKAMSTK